MNHTPRLTDRPMSRRAFMQTVGTAGLGIGVLGSLASSCAVEGGPDPPVVPAHLPSEDLPVPDRIRLPGSLAPTFSGWLLSSFPIRSVSEEWNPEIEVTGRSLDIEEFATEGVADRSYWRSMRGTFYDIPEERWRWDLYVGLVPFVEMAVLVESGIIEPWDPYLPSGAADTWIPPVRDEATDDGHIFGYPFGTSIVAAGWHGGLVEAAGLDPDHAPPTWDDWIGSAHQVMDSGAAPHGASFNPNGWLSLAPIAHSIDGDIYTEAGMFDFTHDAVVEAWRS